MKMIWKISLENALDKYGTLLFDLFHIRCKCMERYAIFE
jgi:hypothetical protein